MQYEETLQYLFTHLPMYQRIGSPAYKKDLTNTKYLLEKLNQPQNQFKSIHIGGTNGKGSVSNMLASILQEAGYKVGLYTSPHLLDFRERIRCNGKMCEQDFVIEFVKNIKPEIEKILPSFFEITVAMAFEYFAKQGVDYAIVEVGLGGRLDSTNVIQPMLSVITNISLDHMQLLGNSIPQIAKEKAGIIKQGAPLIIGEYNQETYKVFSHAAELLHVPFFLAEKNVDLEIIELDLNGIKFNASYLNQLIYPNLFSQLSGNYQTKNLKTVIQAVEVLRNFSIEISDENVYQGLANVSLNTEFNGRMQLMQQDPILIIDCAHNTAGLFELMHFIDTLQYEKLHIITGMVNDKEIGNHLINFPSDATYYFCKPNIPRGLNENELYLEAKKIQLLGNQYKSVHEAIYAAIQNSETNDLLLVCGSIFVAAEALEYFKSN